MAISGLWEKVESELVYGENIAHPAQFVQTGNAEVGVVAPALAVNPELASKGGYWLIPDNLHEPLEQGFIITKQAEGKALAKSFAAYMGSQGARAVMARYGFVLPGETVASRDGAMINSRSGQGFVAGSLIGTLGGLIGLGGAEFRLPVLVGLFRLGTLEAVILNKAMSLVVVTAALLFRATSIAPAQLFAHADVMLNLLAGSLIGAWWAAGHAITLPRLWLNRIVMVLLVGLSLVMLSEAWFGLHDGSAPLFEAGAPRFVAGVIAGFGIGMVAALLGVAGGELLIPTIVLLYGLDVKLAGSLSLAVSLPTMIVGFARYTQADAFGVLRQERPLMLWMAVGSILGAAAGGLLLGLVSPVVLMTLLGIVLLISAIKTFQHMH